MTIEQRVLVLLPRGRDAKLASEILARAGLGCHLCVDVVDLARAIAEGAGAALLAEEAMDGDVTNSALLSWVGEQLPWSDFPFIVLATPRGDIAQGSRAPAWINRIGNVVLLERPFGAAALVSTVRSVLRARRKQYEMRAYLAERELAAAQLLELNASLETRVAERTSDLRAAYDRLGTEAYEREQAEAKLAQAQRMEALGQLAGGIAHDFNNVLQAVTGGLSVIQMRSGDAEAVKRFAGMAANAAARGAAITARLLTFSRRSALHSEALPPLPLLEGLREMLMHTLNPGIVMQIEAAENLPMLQADKGQLETVLVNLAVNARDAMPDGGKLLLTATSETVLEGKAHPADLSPGHYLRLSVGDSGMGMSAATLARASEPFFTTKPLGQGTGLGLAMARGFADQSGGGFLIESVLGHGTTVTLWFPEVDDISLASSPVLPAITAEFAPASAYVLVVDDNPLVRGVLAGQVEGRGYHVAQAADGLEALAQLDTGVAMDLLITDFAMPGMNGLTLIQEARRRRPDLPALLLTGYADAGVRLAVEDTKAGNTVLLRKPVSIAVLSECAAGLLARATAQVNS